MRRFALLCISFSLLASLCYAEKGSRIIRNSSARITIAARDVELHKVLELFSEQSDINFMPGEEVKNKRVTLFLENVILKDALTALIEANALNYRQVGKSKLFVVRSRDILRPKTITRVFRLKYIDLSGKVESDEDKIYADIYYVVKNLLSEYVKVRSTGKGQVDTEIITYGKVEVDLRSNSLIVTDVPENMWRIEKTIKELDKKLQQVMIEIQMVEVASSVLRKLGIEWGGATGEVLTYTGPSRETGFPMSSEGGDMTVGVLSMQQFSAVLKMLSSRGKARFLARPKLLTTNLKTARIGLTADKAIGVEAISETETGLTAQSAERMETGISLEVKPQISPGGLITMLIKPEVSRVSASEYFPGQFVDPQKRSLQTTVIVKDGETVTIGGLLSDVDERTESKIPLLGDIPLLGSLFKSRDFTVTNTELLIFITPHLVKEEELGVVR